MRGVVLSFPVGGVHLRAWTPERLQAEIANANAGIRNALRRGDMDLAWTLIGRKVGLRICAGEVKVKLKPPPSWV